jgi:predicted transcriptional regulator
MRVWTFPKRTGKTEQKCLALIVERGGALNTYALQTVLARTHSGYTKVISRALDRLHTRGIVKREYDSLSEREQFKLALAREAQPKASAFWIVSDACCEEMNII